MKELDLILGRFFEHSINSFSDSEINCYERLLLQDDWLIFSWVSNKAVVPKEFDCLIKKISQFAFSQ